LVSHLAARGIEQIISSRVRRMHDYWTSKCTPERPIPRRTDINVEELRDILPLLTIVEVEYEPLRFRYRLVGTRVVEYNHLEFTGRYLGEIGWKEEEMLLGAYAKAVTERRPSCGYYGWDLQAGTIGACEFAMFPLVNDDGLIHQIIAIEDYEFPARDVDINRI
jgi:hypothetical protein